MLYLNEILKYEKIPGKVIFENDPLPPHWHDNIEIGYFVKGGFTANIDGRWFTVHDDDLLVVNSGQVHHIGDNSVGEDRGVSLVVDMEFLTRMCPDISLLEFDLAISPEKVRDIKNLFRDLYDATILYRRARSSQTQDGFAAGRELLQVNGLVCLIYYMLIKYFSKRAEARNENETFVGKQKLHDSIQFINSHYTDMLTLQDVSAHCGVTREHFSRMFKQYMGMTFKEYLYRIRLAHAYKLLIHTDNTMLDIAMETGFPDLRAFNRQFKEMYGMTPKECRNLLGGLPVGGLKQP